MDAFDLPHKSSAEKELRAQAIEHATRKALEIPFEVMILALESMDVIVKMAEIGNPNSVSDAGVGGLCARAAVIGAFLNVKINAVGLKDQVYRNEKITAGGLMVDQAKSTEEHILKIVDQKIKGQAPAS